MHRIDQDGHVNNLFVEGNPALGQQATRVGAEWLNAVQEELANAIEGPGAPLDKQNNRQLSGLLEGLGGRLGDLEGRAAGDEWSYPVAKTRTLIYPLPMAVPLDPVGWKLALAATNVPAWSTSEAAGGRKLVLPLNSLLRTGQRLTKVELQVKPSASRAVGQRIAASLSVAEAGVGIGGFLPWDLAAAAPFRFGVVGASAEDAGGTNLQVLTLNPTDPIVAGSLRIFLDTMEVFVVVTSGVDQSGGGDVLSAVRLTVIDPGPRNA